MFKEYTMNFLGYSDRMSKEDLKDLYPNWIITDLRFPNELSAIKQRNGITIRVQRDLGLEFGYEENGIFKVHESETALIPYTEKGKWHATIRNDGTLEELYCQLDFLTVSGM